MNNKRNRAYCFISKILVFTLMLSSLVTFSVSALAFSDFDATHWAYESVNTLVASGTINGYEDGTFRPEGTVSRAEFVKMLGKGNSLQTYADISSDHWAYDYIVTSGLEPLDDKNFAPDVAITRDDVAKLLWTRNGSKTGAVVPKMITSQGTNPDVVAWVYSNGMMVGDDYINLRLGDSLTRAEAATLIVRAKAINASTPQINFIDNISDDLLKTVYESFDLIDKPYDANAKVTQGELAKLTMRIACGQNDPTYDRYKTGAPFVHKYVMPFYAYGTHCIGEDKINEKYIDTNATVADAICAVMFGTDELSSIFLGEGNKGIYPELAGKKLNDNQKKYLSLAYENGVTLYAGGKINADKEVTLKELACILLQCDALFGFETPVFYSNANKVAAIKDTMSINNDLGSYPSNAGDYPVILKDVPAYVYETPYITYSDSANSGLDMELYNNCRDFYDIYVFAVRELNYAFINQGASVKLTYIPSLVKNNGHGYTYRLKLEVFDNPNNIKLSDIIDMTDGADGSKVLKGGDVMFVDFDTCAEFSSVFMTAEFACINKVIY